MHGIIRVYLAGGLQTEWREKVINNTIGQFVFFSPKNHGLEKEGANQYTPWDLFHIRKCDIIFGYMEKDNRSGYGLSLEVGYGRALNKTIILVDERSVCDEWFKSKYSIVHEVADVRFENIEKGIVFLNSFSNKAAIKKSI